MKKKIIEPIYSYKALTRKNHNIGKSYVKIDITNQTVYVYSKRELKITTPTVTENVSKGHDTPKGSYFSDQKYIKLMVPMDGYILLPPIAKNIYDLVFQGMPIIVYQKGGVKN